MDKGLHLAKAANNERFLKRVRWANARFTDWQITVLFYIAVHYVDAFLAKVNEHPQTHVLRNKAVKNHLSSLWIDYRRLEDDSREARYEHHSFTRGDVKTNFRVLISLKSQITKLL